MFHSSRVLSTAIGLLLALAANACAAEMSAGKGFPLGTPAQPAAIAVALANTPAVPTQTTPAVPLPKETTAAAASADFNKQPLSFPSDSNRRPRSAEERSFSMPSILPALFAVAVVCGFFCLALYLVKRYMPGHRQLFSTPAVEVLGRTHLDQRRYVSLIRVGKRIVVVGVSPDEMRSLSEIVDEGEVEEILQYAKPKTEAGVTVFGNIFKRNLAKKAKEENEAAVDLAAREMKENASRLKEKVEAIRRSDTTRVERRVIDTVG